MAGLLLPRCFNQTFASSKYILNPPIKSRFGVYFICLGILSHFYSAGFFQILQGNPACRAVTSFNLKFPSSCCTLLNLPAINFMVLIGFVNCMGVLAMIHNDIEELVLSAFIVDLREKLLSKYIVCNIRFIAIWEMDLVTQYNMCCHLLIAIALNLLIFLMTKHSFCGSFITWNIRFPFNDW